MAELDYTVNFSAIWTLDDVYNARLLLVLEVLMRTTLQRHRRGVIVILTPL